VEKALALGRSGSERRTFPMSEENKALARLYWEEAINKGNLDALDEVYNPDSVIHGSSQ
jgi:hypothetical protein